MHKRSFLFFWLFMENENQTSPRPSLIRRGVGVVKASRSSSPPVLRRSPGGKVNSRNDKNYT
jgi:hypothetical protein